MDRLRTKTTCSPLRVKKRRERKKRARITGKGKGRKRQLSEGRHGEVTTEDKSKSCLYDRQGNGKGLRDRNKDKAAVRGGYASRVPVLLNATNRKGRREKAKGAPGKRREPYERLSPLFTTKRGKRIYLMERWQGGGLTKLVR